MSYYGFRYYDAGNGRWSSRDPINELGFYVSQENGSIEEHPDDVQLGNDYALLFNNSVNAFDMLGLYTLKQAYKRTYVSQTNDREPMRRTRTGRGMGINPRWVSWYARYRSWLRRKSKREKFDMWYALELARANRSRWWQVLPKCPILLCGAPNNPQNPDRNLWKNPARPRTAEQNLHPGAYWSMRSKPQGGHANQCTYTRTGVLLFAAPAAGSVDYYEGPSLAHYRHDVQPVVLAGQCDSIPITASLPRGMRTGFRALIAGNLGQAARTYVRKYYQVRPLWAEAAPLSFSVFVSIP